MPTNSTRARGLGVLKTVGGLGELLLAILPRRVDGFLALMRVDNLDIGNPKGLAILILKAHRHLAVDHVEPQNLALAKARAHALAGARQGFAHAPVDLLLVDQTAHQAPAHPRDFGRVKRKPLVLAHANRDRREVTQKGAAT